MAAFVGVALLAAPVDVPAQPAAKTPVIGYVTSVGRSGNVEAFEGGLRELGWMLGQDVSVTYRFAEGNVERVPALIDELLRLKVDVLFAANPHVIRVARQATSTVPIVGIDLETDPMQSGWIKSLAKPGGNLTGFFLDMPELGGKQLQFLIEAVPRLQRVAVLWDGQLDPSQFRAVERAAQAAKVAVQSVTFRRPDEFSGALGTAHDRQAQAVILLSSPTVFMHLRALSDLALRNRLPAISVFPQFAEAGGLMGYGPNLQDLYRRGAGYVDRILRGAQPGDLPIQRPTVFELTINLNAAKSLGLAMPPGLVSRADRVIQ